MRTNLFASTLVLLTLVTTLARADGGSTSDPATLDLAHAVKYTQYYAPPPPPPPGYYAPRRYYYRPLPPPWIRPLHFVRPYFGLSGFGTIVAGQSGGVEYLRNGGGLGIFGGLDFGRVVGLEINYNASFHNPIDNCGGGPLYGWCGANYLTVETLALDIKLHIPTDTRFVPYGQAGAVLSWIGRQDSPSDATGGGFEVGGGFDIWLNRVVTLGAQALYKGLFMSDYATYTGTGTYLDMIYVGGNVQFHLLD